MYLAYFKSASYSISLDVDHDIVLSLSHTRS